MRPGAVIALSVAGLAALAGLGLLGLRVVGSTAVPATLEALIASLPAGITLTHGNVAFSAASGYADLRRVTLARDGQTILTADDLRITGMQGLGLTTAPRRIGHITLSKVTIGKTWQQIGRIEMSGLAAENLRQILSADSYPAGRAAWTDMRPLADSVEVFDANAHQDAPPGHTGRKRMPGIDIVVGHARMAGITGRQLQNAPTLASLSDPAVATDVALAIGEASSGIENIRVTIEGQGGLTIASATAGAYAGGKLAAEDINDVAINTDANIGSASLHQISVKGVDLVRILAEVPAVIAAQQNGVPPPNIGGLMKFADLTVAGLSVDVHQWPKITLESLASHVSGGDEAAETSTGGLHNLQIAFSGRDMAAAVTKQLDSFGMQDFTIDSDGTSDIDLQAGRVAITKDDLIIHGLGTLHLTFALENYFPGTGTAAEMMNRIRQARLIRATLGWDDASLLGRVLKISAAKSGKTEAELRAGISKALARLPLLIPAQPDAADQIEAFLKGQHNITFTMEPAAPASLGEIGGAPSSDKATMLGLKISGN